MNAYTYIHTYAPTQYSHVHTHTHTCTQVSLGEKKTLASAAANKPIQVTGDKKDNTIFVDVIEKITVVLDK
jgi:hypothetical protein